MYVLNVLKQIGATVGQLLIPLLFLLGLALIITASFVAWGLIVGMISTGVVLILLALILVGEKAQQEPPK